MKILRGNFILFQIVSDGNNNLKRHYFTLKYYIYTEQYSLSSKKIFDGRNSKPSSLLLFVTWLSLSSYKNTYLMLVCNLLLILIRISYKLFWYFQLSYDLQKYYHYIWIFYIFYTFFFSSNPFRTFVYNSVNNIIKYNNNLCSI